jgi:hypothetical protein
MQAMEKGKILKSFLSPPILISLQKRTEAPNTTTLSFS